MISSALQRLTPELRRLIVPCLQLEYHYMRCESSRSTCGVGPTVQALSGRVRTTPPPARDEHCAVQIPAVNVDSCLVRELLEDLSNDLFGDRRRCNLFVAENRIDIASGFGAHQSPSRRPCTSTQSDLSGTCVTRRLAVGRRAATARAHYERSSSASRAKSQNRTPLATQPSSHKRCSRS